MFPLTFEVDKLSHWYLIKSQFVELQNQWIYFIKKFNKLLKPLNLKKKFNFIQVLTFCFQSWLLISKLFKNTWIWKVLNCEYLKPRFCKWIPGDWDKSIFILTSLEHQLVTLLTVNKFQMRYYWSTNIKPIILYDLLANVLHT